jgi:hypothetical protein
MIWEDIGIAFIVIAGVLLVVLGVVLFFWLRNRRALSPSLSTSTPTIHNNITMNVKNPAAEGHQTVPSAPTAFPVIVKQEGGMMLVDQNGIALNREGIDEVKQRVGRLERDIKEALKRCTEANASLYGAISEIMVQFKSISYRERQFWRITEQPAPSQPAAPGAMNQNAFLMMRNNATQQQQEDIKNSDLLKGMVDEVNSYTITNNEITTKLIEWNSHMNEIMIHKSEDHLLFEQEKMLKNTYIDVLNWEYKLEDMSRKAQYTKQSLTNLANRLDVDTKQVLSTQNSTIGNGLNNSSNNTK